MIVASPRPIAAASEPAPLLRLRADEIQLECQQLQLVHTPQSKMAVNPDQPPNRENNNAAASHQIHYILPEECQNGERDPLSSISSSLTSGDDTWKEPPPKYTRHSTCSYPFPGHAAQPSTSSTTSTSSASASSCSTSTARPSFESFTTPSDHSHSHSHQQNREREQKEEQMTQRASVATQINHSLIEEELGSTAPPAPPYDSSFTDTNLTGLPDEALSALSLARENLADLERASFAEFDDLDRSDDRIDPDAIVQRRLTRNLLLTRQSAITLASASSASVYSDGTQPPPRESVYSTVTYDCDFDPARVSVQTYGSSVLTYGSRASQLLDGEIQNVFSSSNGGNGGGDGSRPVAPLPWLPRPSALDRIQHCGIGVPANCVGRARSGSTGSVLSATGTGTGSGSAGTGTGRRPLPPLPTPTSASASSGSSPILTRDRSVSLPSRSTSSGSNYSVTSASSPAGNGMPRRPPRPLPRTPSSAVSAAPPSSYNLPDIKEGEASESVPPSSGPVRSNSMFLSPTSAAAAAAPLAPLNFSKGRKSARYSTIGYGHASRAAGVRGLFLRNSTSLSEESAEDVGAGVGAGTGQVQLQRPSQGYGNGRTASRASTRSAQTLFLVPDVEELVRILDSMDDGSGSGSSSESALATPIAAPWESSRPSVSVSVANNNSNKKTSDTGVDAVDDADADDGEEEIDMGEALACSRSVVNVPCGEKRARRAAAALEDLGLAKSIAIGLPTPAATPRSSPHRHPATLPPASETRQPAPPVPPVPSKPQLQGRQPEPGSQADEALSLSPAPSSATTATADALSLTNFPMPPIMAPLYIPAPGAVGAADMPIPIPSGEPSPSVAEFGKSPAEKAMLPGMVKEFSLHPPQASTTTTTTQQKHISTRDAIADLKHRVSELPVLFPIKKGRMKFPSGVPLLSFPVPPRRRAQSSASATATTTTAKSTKSTQTQKKQKYSHPPPAIDVRAANSLVPPSSFNKHVGKSAGSSSAPANNLFFDFSRSTVIYETPAPAPAPAPPVAPLKIPRASSHIQGSGRADVKKVQIPPSADVPQSASAAQTTFSVTTQPPSAGRAQRATSFCVSPNSSSSPAVPPLRFKSAKTAGSRARSATLNSGPSAAVPRKQEQVRPGAVPAPAERKSSETDASEESESDQLATPTAPHAPLADVVEHTPADDARERGTGISVINNGSFAALEQANGTHVSLDPAFADIIKSMAGSSEEEQMGSLLTIASSINTEHHASGYNAGFFVPIVDESRTRDDDGFVDVDEDGNENALGRREAARKSTASGVSASERRKSKTKSISSMKKRHSTRSAAAVRAAIRALPDPSTFPIPDSGGSVATNSSAGAGAADFAGFGMRPSPLPKLRVVTKFKGGTVLLPASQAPLSASSTKSTMSSFGGGHSRNASAVSINVKRSSTTGGVRKMNRLTLTDPRSPMNDATVKAAALVARVRQKRAALALRNRAAQAASGHDESVDGQDTVNNVIVVQRSGHARTGSGSSGTLRSRLKMSGGGFFGGGSVRPIPNPGRIAVAVPSVDTTPTAVSTTAVDSESDGIVLRSGPRAHRPTIRRPRMARTSVVLPKSGQVDLCS